MRYAGALAKLEVIIEEDCFILQEPETRQAIRVGAGEETTEHYLSFAKELAEDGCNLPISPTFEFKMRKFGIILEDLLTGVNSGKTVKSFFNNSSESYSKRTAWSIIRSML